MTPPGQIDPSIFLPNEKSGFAGYVAACVRVKRDYGATNHFRPIKMLSEKTSGLAIEPLDRQ